MLTFSIQNTNTFNKFKKSQNVLSFKAGSQEFYYKVFDNLSKASKCGILNLNFKNPQDEKTFRTLLDSGYAVYQPWENLGFQHQMKNFKVISLFILPLLLVSAINSTARFFANAITFNM